MCMYIYIYIHRYIWHWDASFALLNTYGLEKAHHSSFFKSELHGRKATQLLPDHDDRWWCLWNLHDDFSFYHAGIKNVVANISDWHPFKTKKQICNICVYLLGMSDPNTTAAAHPTCQTLHGSLPFQTKNRDTHPGQKGPNSVEENICEQKLQDLKPGPQWEFHTVVKEGPDRGDLTRSLYKNLLKASLANFHTSTF